MKHCKTSKKNSSKKNEKDENSNDEKFNKKSKKNIWQQQQIKTAQELDFDSSNESAAVIMKQSSVETAMQIKKSRQWLINSETTSHCTNDQSIFVFFTFRNRKLSTAEESLEITESENVIINLTNNFTVRLSEVLMISDIETNLLFIQILIIQKIIN